MTNQEIIQEIHSVLNSSDAGPRYGFSYDDKGKYIGKLALDFSSIIDHRMSEYYGHRLLSSTYNFTTEEQEYLRLKFS